MIFDPSIPQPQPLPTMGVRSSQDIVDHLDKVLAAQPPEVQDAVNHAHGILGLQAPAGMASADAGTPAGASTPVLAPEAPQPVDAASGGISPIVSVAPSDAQPLPTPGIRSANPSPEALKVQAPANPHMENLERMTAEGPGVNKIHNPFLRGLAHVGDAIGSGLFPEFTRFIPGFTAHHQELLNEERGQLGTEQKAAKSAADVAQEETATEHQQAEVPLVNAQTEETAAKTEALKNPQPKQEEAGKTITTDQGIMQWNPKTQRYDIQAGKSPTKETKETGTVHQLEDGSLIVAHPDGTATPVTVDGKPVKGPPKEKSPGSPEQQFIDEYRQRHEGSSIADAEKAFRQLTPKEQADHGVTMIDPATHQVVRLEPGQIAPAGAMTPQQIGAQNAPTTQMRNVAAQAALVHEQTPAMLQEIDRLKDSIGPVAGRWNEFMQGKVGADNPDMAGLRADLLMYSSAVALMHARGRLPENLREEFDHAINAPKQTAENLKAVIRKVDDWTAKNQTAMGGNASAGSAPTKSSVDDLVNKYGGKR